MADRAVACLTGYKESCWNGLGDVPTKADNTHTHIRWLTKAYRSIWVVDDSVVFCCSILLYNISPAKTAVAPIV